MCDLLFGGNTFFIFSFDKHFFANCKQNWWHLSFKVSNSKILRQLTSVFQLNVKDLFRGNSLHWLWPEQPHIFISSTSLYEICYESNIFLEYFCGIFFYIVLHTFIFHNVWINIMLSQCWNVSKGWFVHLMIL